MRIHHEGSFDVGGNQVTVTINTPACECGRAFHLERGSALKCVTSGTREVDQPMPTYVVLFEKTDEGRTISSEDAQERRQRGLEIVEEVGGEVRSLYYGSGRYDIVGIADLPDGEAVGKVQTAYESLGLTSIEAWEVFEPAEWNEILEDAPM